MWVNKTNIRVLIYVFVIDPNTCFQQSDHFQVVYIQYIPSLVNCLTNKDPY
jgi:hypothetical protein